jgi:hypothetical protein
MSDISEHIIHQAEYSPNNIYEIKGQAHIGLEKSPDQELQQLKDNLNLGVKKKLFTNHFTTTKAANFRYKKTKDLKATGSTKPLKVAVLHCAR